MAQKNNIRSIRISDDMAELIDRQVGANFTEKWENLVTRCAWELPQKEEQLKQIQQQIKHERERLHNLHDLYNKLNWIFKDLEKKTSSLSNSINQAIREIDHTL